MKLKCPRCGKETESTGNPFRPFCSGRCKTIDLGNWIQGAYRIHTREVDQDEDGAPAEPAETDEL